LGGDYYYYLPGPTSVWWFCNSEKVVRLCLCDDVVAVVAPIVSLFVSITPTPFSQLFPELEDVVNKYSPGWMDGG